MKTSFNKITRKFFNIAYLGMSLSSGLGTIYRTR